MTLTPREWDIVYALARGRKSREVAGDLGISTQTVKNHLTSVYRKLEVDSLVGAFIALGWLRPPSGSLTADEVNRYIVELYTA